MAEKTIDEQLKQADLEMKQLQLEDLRIRLQAEREKRAMRLRAAAKRERSIDDYNQSVIAQQSLCHHRKGGKNMEGILAGHDGNYSVQKHTYPWGETVAMCTRCSKEWRAPKKELRKTDAAEFKRQMEEYRTALAWPTDNEPSGTQIFLVIDNRAQRPEKPGKEASA